METMDNIEDIILKNKIKYMEPMYKHTTMRVGGPADIFAMPTSEKDIIEILTYAKKNKIPVTIIGNGSKIVVTDKGIRGIVIKLGNQFSNYVAKGEYITAESGMFVPKLSLLARDLGLSGLEFAAGIPGAVGGSVVMNAGAYCSEMSACVIETTYINEKLEIKKLKSTEHQFEYRRSIFFDNPSWIIISSKFKLIKGNKEEITTKMKENQKLRKEKQPLEYPSAGSVFKRPPGHFVGQMIEELGLKGYSIGGAEISSKHAGFIVNKNSATATDIIKLIEYIKEKVFNKYSVHLESEIKIIGEK